MAWALSCFVFRASTPSITSMATTPRYFYLPNVFGRVAKTKFSMKKQSLFVAFAMFALIGFGQVPNYVPTNGLAGYWPFNGNANDESGNGNDGTVNGATLTSDRSGANNAAYYFDGTSDFIDVQHSASLICNDEITMSCWIYSNSMNTGLTQTVLSKGQQSSYWNYGISIDANSLISYNYTNYGIGPLNVLGANEWHQLTFSINQSLNIMHVFFNGVEQTPLYDVNTNTLITNFQGIINSCCTANLNIGKNAGGQAFFSGKIDDIGIWNRALTEEEIQALYIGCNVAPTTIAGNLTPATLTTADYACNNNSGSTYQWTVTNGVITAGQGTSNVTVLWGAEGIGTLSVVETNADGCSGAPATIDVNVTCVTSATAISGPLGPNALTATTYTCDGDAGSTYQWSISNGVISSGQGTNTVTVLWAGTGLGNISVQETTNVNCIGNTISMDVVVIPTGVEELESPIAAIYPNPAKDIVTIDFGKTSSVHGQSIKIVNSLGQVVNSFNVTSQLVVVDVSTWASGTYLLSVLNGTGTQVQTKTLIIE